MHVNHSRISPVLIEAINVHKWFLSKRLEKEVSFVDAEEDFLLNYLIPWIEQSNPEPDINPAQGNLINRCNHLRAMMMVQVPAYEKAVRDDQWYLGQFYNNPIKWDDAQTDFIKNYVQEWGDKFRRAYCGHICPDRSRCKISLELFDLSN